MERATKLLVLGWACTVLAAQVWLVRRGWPDLVTLAACAFVAAAALSAFDRRAVGAVLALAYVFPALMRIFHGRYHVYFGVLWMAALLGAMAPDGVRKPWQIPTRWRGPLVCWALVIMTSASIVVAREVDFSPALIFSTAIANARGGGWPAFHISWSLHVALILLLGILWFDWLFGLSEREFFQGVVTPLAVSALAMASVGIYQLFGDFTFLNVNVFGGTGRASGTMFDANVFGMLAALWVGGIVIWAQRLGKFGSYATVAGWLATWLAVWASGSRTAFAAAVVVSACSLPALLAVRLTKRRLIAYGAGFSVIVLVTVVALLTMADAKAVGPIERLWGMMPAPTVDSVGNFAVAMWDRNRYGSTAAVMFSEFPLVGVGVGFFHALVPEYARLFSIVGSLIGDNAQNWYRHQLVELGLIGSLGWMAWAVMFGAFVLAGRHISPAAWIARGMLVGLAFVSLLGMPTQDVSVSMTFWTAAFWFTSLAGAPPAATPLGRRSWVAIAIVVIAYAIGTAEVAATRLRVPVRAQRVGWPYSYGFYPPEPDGRGGEQRWTGRRAVAVLEASTGWLELTMSANHQAITSPGEDRAGSIAPTRPVEVRVWRNGELVLQIRLTNTAPVTEYLRVPDGHKWIFIETKVDRVFRPRDLGIPDDRELGVLIKWSFVPRPAHLNTSAALLTDRARSRTIHTP
jgi:hypothetical protein